MSAPVRHLLLAVLLAVMATLPSGCWWLGRFWPFQPRETRLSAWGITRLAIVPFADATNQQATLAVSRAFERQLDGVLGPDHVVITTGTDLGLIGITRARQLGRSLGCEAILTGQILAYGTLPRSGRVWVSVSLRLLEAGRGSIIWSRNTTGSCPVSDAASNACLDVATELAAKEFIHDILAPPSADRIGGFGRPAGHSLDRDASTGHPAPGHRG